MYGANPMTSENPRIEELYNERTELAVKYSEVIARGDKQEANRIESAIIKIGNELERLGEEL
ncbi:hypothetical protein [Microtetraspora malaysiensis]|uniref:Uncharacterized protein n=1 Tax=Microtetraspora malaysiensis TaxID=161358 RepID=A0ABW6SKF6_9ACTN